MLLADVYGSYINKDVKEFVCGIEYEIEQVSSLLTELSNSSKVSVTKDGSLRESGYEFITRPLTYEEQLTLFPYIHDNISFFNSSLAYSHRTSTHVHVNCGSLTEEQTKALILLYALMEPEFFNMVAPHRKHNIHCVPLSFTSLPNIYKKSVHSLIAPWSKYTALNIKPLATQSTIEFRHLEGTGDIEVVKRWLLKIKGLYDFVVNHPEFNLGECLAEGLTITEIHELIYGNLPVLPPEAFETSTIDVKESFL